MFGALPVYSIKFILLCQVANYKKYINIQSTASIIIIASFFKNIAQIK
jgi:hypothetical protein